MLVKVGFSDWCVPYHRRDCNRAFNCSFYELILPHAYPKRTILTYENGYARIIRRLYSRYTLQLNWVPQENVILAYETQQLYTALENAQSCVRIWFSTPTTPASCFLDTKQTQCASTAAEAGLIGTCFI